MNNITSFEGLDYLDTTASIDISSNSLNSISETAIDKIRESPVQSIHLDGHQIKSFSISIRQFFFLEKTPWDARAMICGLKHGED